ncbi:MAG: TVP38/TMEM64 family protein, partial [Alphaproteobacteria bacterium]|nr:TVP38/TMEM64 family protein [Alphaproteobacteria bacterium]
TYIVATFFGIIPGTFVYASVGNGLGALFDAGDDPDLGIIFEPQFLAPLIGLAVLAVIPVIYKKFQKSRNQAPSA